jgi:hypothetical protein
MKKHIVIWSTLLLLNNQVLAKDFSYPELMVKPSASERLLMEAKNEKKRGILEPLALQISAITTFTSGLMQFTMNNNDGVANVTEQDKDDTKMAGLTGMIVGGTWLAINYTQFTRKKAYWKAYKKVKGMKGNSKEARLSKERIAEEELAYRAELARKFTYVSVGTNLAASLYMMSTVEKESMSELTNAVALVASFMPLLFKTREERIYKQHKEYKKKIYAPLVNFRMFYDQVAKTYRPGLGLSLTF